jgi:hypothetical protein
MSDVVATIHQTASLPVEIPVTERVVACGLGNVVELIFEYKIIEFAYLEGSS